MINLVFVYGTLKRGFPNNHLLHRARFVGEGQTVARCRLFHAGFPVLRKGLEGYSCLGAPVRGEVYLVTDQATMDALDNLEGEGRMYHRRSMVIQLDRGKRIRAFTYVGDSKFWNTRRVKPYLPEDDLHEWPALRVGDLQSYI